MIFVGPRATFDIGAQAFPAAGKTLRPPLRGDDQLAYALEDVRRAVRLGIESILVSSGVQRAAELAPGDGRCRRRNIGDAEALCDLDPLFCGLLVQRRMRTRVVILKEALGPEILERGVGRVLPVDVLEVGNYLSLLEKHALKVV